MRFSSSIVYIASALVGSSVVSGHDHVYSKRELEQHYARQASIAQCAHKLSARGVSARERVEAKRSAIQVDRSLFLERRQAPTGNGSMPGGDMGGSTTYVATATVTEAVKTTSIDFPSATLSAKSASATGQNISQPCDLTPEQEEGPYYESGVAIRTDIAEDQVGIPFYFEFNVVDTNTCEPLSGAAIDIWHCNATGVYSGYGAAAENLNTSEIAGNEHVGDYNDAGSQITDDLTFGRGVQLTDDDGLAEFTSFLPGWYSGRTAHIHVRVHIDGVSYPNGTYIGGNLSHTGQTFFGEDIYEEVQQISPYSETSTPRTTNDEDRVYADQNGTNLVWNAYYVEDGNIEAGLIGTLTLAIDSTATNMTGYTGM